MKKTGSFRIVMLIVVAFMLITAAGCANKKADANTREETGEKPIVAVSIVPQQTFVEAVCGDLAEVITMVPPGSSPENYEPTPKEMEQFSNAKVYFTIGVPTEEANILPKAEESSDLEIVSLQDDVAKVYPDRELAPGERDPHIWLSPKRAIVMVQSIAREMEEIDPTNKDQYEENAQAYIAELEDLDGEIQTALAGVENRKFIVFHPAFGYLADDYGLEMYALEEEGKESTPQKMQELIDLAKKENIKAIFYQAEISSTQAEAFAEEIGGKTVQLAPLAPNYIENLKNMATLMSEVMQ
ncbi:MAG: zinc ABC transporter substrate-binding protein [Anaerotignum sp.]|nr:zinc ABC transporter substrate-binding protein [Anaerotignum sp.]